MPGISTGTPNTKDYQLGRGIVYLGNILTTPAAQVGQVGAWRDVGNATSFNLTVNRETLEHFSSRSGLKKLDAEVLISQDVNLSITVDELNFDNLSVFFSGSMDTTTQTGATLTPVAPNFNVSVSGLGRWYDLYDDINMTAYPEGSRVYRLSAVSVKNTAQTITYVLGVDYTLDLEWGRIFIPTTSAITAAQNIAVLMTTATLTYDRIKGLTTTLPSIAVKFISENAQNANKQAEVTFHSVKLTAEGDLAMIGDEFGTLQLSGKAQASEAAFPDSPTMTIVSLSS